MLSVIISCIALYRRAAPTKFARVFGFVGTDEWPVTGGVGRDGLSLLQRKMTETGTKCAALADGPATTWRGPACRGRHASSNVGPEGDVAAGPHPRRIDGSEAARAGHHKQAPVWGWDAHMRQDDVTDAMSCRPAHSASQTLSCVSSMLALRLRRVLSPGHLRNFHTATPCLSGHNKVRASPACAARPPVLTRLRARSGRKLSNARAQMTCRRARSTAEPTGCVSAAATIFLRPFQAQARACCRR